MLEGPATETTGWAAGKRERATGIETEPETGIEIETERRIEVEGEIEGTR